VELPPPPFNRAMAAYAGCLLLLPPCFRSLGRRQRRRQVQTIVVSWSGSTCSFPFPQRKEKLEDNWVGPDPIETLWSGSVPHRL